MAFDKLLEKFKDAANQMNAAQQKTTRFITHDEATMRWRDLFNSLDEVSLPSL